MQIETPRLLLRQFQASDAQAFFELNADPEVLKYTGDAAFVNVDEARKFILAYDHYKKHGFGRWSVVLKETGDFMGWCGLKYTPDLNEYDIGFRFLKIHWNKGYATESANTCLEIGFNQFNLSKIVGRAVKENKASIAVLEKIGLRYQADMDFHGMPGVKFSIEKSSS